MNLRLTKYTLLAALGLSPIGCQPEPVVVEPDGETTVIEERETTEEPNPDRSGADVNVGGEGGVDVKVDTDAQPGETP